ncbi:MAG: hypothetical protein L0H84_01315 [Pseudonocardia sp.]|nr:hypothetical protein [Pseudonocardia sp.]
MTRVVAYWMWSNMRSIIEPGGRAGEAPDLPGPCHRVPGKDVLAVEAWTRMFGSREPAPIQVRYQDGEPVEFERRPLRRGSRFFVTDVRGRWIESSPWPFPSPEPVGGDQLRCWHVVARVIDDPAADAHEFVLRMRAGPGVWDLVRVRE